jgi:hypothetical protein
MSMQKGDYVLATKWSDADPGDHWCVGHYDELKYGDRHMVVDNDGKQFRANGFRHVYPITDAEGRWMIEHIPEIDKTMFWTDERDDGTEFRRGTSVLEWLERARAEIRSTSDAGVAKP